MGRYKPKTIIPTVVPKNKIVVGSIRISKKSVMLVKLLYSSSPAWEVISLKFPEASPIDIIEIAEAGKNVEFFKVSPSVFPELNCCLECNSSCFKTGFLSISIKKFILLKREVPESKRIERFLKKDIENYRLYTLLKGGKIEIK